MELSELIALTASVEPVDQSAMLQAHDRQLELTKPTGSLGRLEELAIQIAGITGQIQPELKRRAVVVMAADHGITSEGVSAYPAEVTPQMVHNFLRGGAAINALARQAQAEVIVVDVGVAVPLSHPQLLSRKVRPGTANMLHEPAMTQEQALQAISTGCEVVEMLVTRNVDLLAIGEMGIGNTTAASAIVSALLQVPVKEVTGRGTGLDDQQLLHKIALLERVLERHDLDPRNPLEILATVGGLEIAGLVGTIIAAVARRIPVVLDGFIASSAACIAHSLCPKVREYLIAGHVSVERGHKVILDYLQLKPLLNLNLRLGEGTGAVLAMQLIEAALRTHNEMATFAEAGVSNREES